MMKRAALLDKGLGMFLADGGGMTLTLHNIMIFNANEGEDGELLRYMCMFPHLECVECEGEWCKEYGVRT